MNTTGTIIVIGASSGLGKGIAEHYASQGWKVGVCARREEPLRALADRFPGRIFWRTLDVTADNCLSVFQSLIEELGGMDVVLYAAGCGWNNPTLDVAKDERTVDTNVLGFTRIVNASFEWFDKNPTPSRQRGALCAITSIAGTKGIGISATYSATKRYQNTYLESLAQLATVRKVPVSIIDIRPGFIDTALLDTSAHRYPMLMPVDYAVRRIVRAIDRRRKVAYVDWRWHIVTSLWKLIPRWLWIRLKLNL